MPRIAGLVRPVHSAPVLAILLCLAAFRTIGPAARRTSAAGPNCISTSGPLVPRAGHTATLLRDGTVLLAGDGASAERYDPAAGTWQLTGALQHVRRNHDAALLGNGKALVVGGELASVAATAEVYDPATGVWTATGSLTTARSSFTTTTLRDGRVLVAGGWSSDRGLEALRSAEVYDPATDVWLPVAAMTEARRSAAAALLADGRVLVTGGDDVGSAEVYDPLVNRWSSAGRMAESRTYHTATLLADGTVLVAGGFHDLASAELYDPVAGTWSVTGSMPRGRSGHTATLLADGRVLVAGGSSAIGAQASAEIYDPGTGAWTLAGSMSVGRERHTATLLHTGAVLITGGGARDAAAPAEIYAPAAGAWVAAGGGAEQRSGHTATLLADGRVLVAGGTLAGDAAATPPDAEIYTAGALPPGGPTERGLAAALLTLDDLPAGWEPLAPPVQRQNAGLSFCIAATPAPDSTPGWSAAFGFGGQPVGPLVELFGPLLVQTVHSYEAGEAERLMDATVQQAQTCTQPARASSTSEPLALAPLDDQSVAQRISIQIALGPAGPDGEGAAKTLDLRLDLIAIRQGNAITALAVYRAMAPEGDLLDLVGVTGDRRHRAHCSRAAGPGAEPVLMASLLAVQPSPEPREIRDRRRSGSTSALDLRVCGVFLYKTACIYLTDERASTVGESGHRKARGG